MGMGMGVGMRMGLSWPFAKTMQIKCPGGHTAIVYRDLNDALPLYLKDLSVKGGAKGSAVGLGDGEISSEYQATVSQILFAISERNSSQVLDYRNAYLAYMSDPCRKGDFLERVSDRIREDRSFLDRLQARANVLIEMVKRSPENADQIISYCGSIMTDLGMPDAPSATKAIGDARQDAHDMIGDGHAS